MKWQEIDFEKLYLIPSRNGLSRPSKVRGSGYKFINMGELFAYDRICSNVNMERVQMNDKELSTMLVEEGDLLFARQSLVLAGAGKCSIVKEINEPTTFESHLIRVRLNQEIVNSQFYYYYFKSPICKIRSIVTQGVQAGIRGNDLKKLKVHLPPLPTQEKIANILSKYDDLIENNRRRIELLEKSARLLYKEWFVYLRFPGHEHTPFIDGIPDGWERKTLKELCDSVSYGYTAQSSEEAIGSKFLRITDIVPPIISWESVPFCIISEQDFKKFSLQEGDIVVARTGATVGYAKRIGKITNNSVFASYLVRFRFSEQLNNIIAGIFMESDFYKAFVRNHAGGAAQPNANAKILGSANILVPTKLIQNSFCNIVTPIILQKEILTKQNQKLKQARDILLPRLMNGEINV